MCMKEQRFAGSSPGLMAGWMCLCLLLLQPLAQGEDDMFSFERMSEDVALLQAIGEETDRVLVKDVEPSAAPPRDEPGETQPSAYREREDFAAVSMWRSLGSLLLIVGALFLVSRWMRGRFSGQLASGPARRMSIVERLPLDHRRQLLLVRVDDREVIMALSPNQIEPVAQWERAWTGSSAAGEEEQR